MIRILKISMILMKTFVNKRFYHLKWNQIILYYVYPNNELHLNITNCYY